MREILVFCVVLLTFHSCTEDHYSAVDIDEQLFERIDRASRTGSSDFFILKESDDYVNLPNQDPHNTITKEKVELGRLLFFEPALAQNPIEDNCYETYSCSSCHIPSRGWLPGRMQGIADGAIGFGDFGSRRVVQFGYDEDELDAQGTRPMSVLNVTYMTNTLWSGLFGADDVNEGTESRWTGLAEVNHTGYVGLEAQNIEGFDLHRLEINDRVLDEFGYREMFDEAFPNYPEDVRYSPETASFAMGAFLRTILTTEAPFQDYLKGDYNAMTLDEKKGALLFFGKARCFACHNSPSFSNMEFHALGTPDMYEFGGLNTWENDPRNLGRGMFTGKEEDNYKFKVPQLYNLADFTHYFHGSSKTSIEDVIEFKAKAQSENSHVENSRLSNVFKPLDLTPADKMHLSLFLKNALHDKGTERYMPESVLSGYCFPNNDIMARKEMGCD
jgi:cytochrome c peroxidase